MKQATGRDPDEVSTMARCLLSTFPTTREPSAEMRAAASFLAFGLRDLHRLTLLLSGDGKG